jgi:hypothetical protein
MADTKDLIVRLTLENGQFKSEVVKASAATKQMKTETEKLKTTIGGIKAGWVAAAAAIAGALGTLKKAMDFAKEFAEFREASDAMESQFGVNATSIIQKLKEASRGMLSMRDSVTIANKAMTAGITDVQQIADLYKIAESRADAFGMSGKDAFEGLVEGIMKGTPRILESLGFQTDSWQNVAKSTGKAYDSQFLMNQVLTEGSALLKDSGGAESYADKFDRLSATLADMRVKIGGAAINIFGPMADAISSLVGEDRSLAGVTSDLIRLNTEYNTVTKKLTSTTLELTDAQRTSLESQKKLLEADIQESIVKVRNSYSDVKIELREIGDKLKENTENQKNANRHASVMNPLQSILKDLTAEENKLKREQAELQKEQADGIAVIATALRNNLITETERKLLGDELIALAEKEKNNQVANEKRLKKINDDKSKAVRQAEADEKARAKAEQDAQRNAETNAKEIADLLALQAEYENAGMDSQLAALKVDQQRIESKLAISTLTDAERMSLEKILALNKELFAAREKEIADAGIKTGASGEVKDPELDKIEKRKVGMEEYFELSQAVFSGISDIVETHNAREMEILNAKHNKIMSDKETELDAVWQAAKESGASSDELTKIEENNKIILRDLEKGLDAEALKEKKRAAKAAKAANLVEAITNTAAGVSRAFKDYAMPWALIPAAAAGIAGGVQIGKIASEPIPAFASGGVVGGVMQSPMTPPGEDGLVAVQRGESILTRQATAILGPDAISMLNGMGGSSNVNVTVQDARGAVKILNDWARTQGGNRGSGL